MKNILPLTENSTFFLKDGSSFKTYAVSNKSTIKLFSDTTTNPIWTGDSNKHINKSTALNRHKRRYRQKR